MANTSGWLGRVVEPVGALDGLSQCEVTRKNHVFPPECEDQRTLNCPRAYPGDRRQRRDEIIVWEFAQCRGPIDRLKAAPPNRGGSQPFAKTRPLTPVGGRSEVAHRTGIERLAHAGAVLTTALAVGPGSSETGPDLWHSRHSTSTTGTSPRFRS
jgi:hypothetical protein